MNDDSVLFCSSADDLRDSGSLFSVKISSMIYYLLVIKVYGFFALFFRIYSVGPFCIKKMRAISVEK